MTAANTFQALFETVTLAKTVRRYATGAKRPHTAIYQRGEKIVAPIAGNTVGWKETRFSRDLARVTGPGSPTKAAQKPKQTPKSATLIDIKEHVDLPPEWLYLLQNPDKVGDVAVDNARAQFADAMLQISNKIANTCEFICTKANLGSLDLSAVPNSELSHTITYPVKSQAKVTSWAAATTKIRSAEIPALRDAYLKAAGFEAGRAVATKTVEGYITQNAEIANFLQGHSLAARALEASFAEGGALPTLGGLGWDFVNPHYALDATPDTTVDYQTDDVVVVLPPEAMWSEAFAMGEGYEVVPAGPAFALGGPEAVGQLLIPIQGHWCYVEVVTNPVLIRLHCGYKCLPIQKIPNAVMAFDSV